MMARNAVMVVVGAGFCWPLYLVLRRLHRAPIARLIATGTLHSLPLALMLTMLVFSERFLIAPQQLYSPREVHMTTVRGFFAREVTELFLLFAGLSTLCSSVTSAIEGREADEPTAWAEVAMLDAGRGDRT